MSKEDIKKSMFEDDDEYGPPVKTSAKVKKPKVVPANQTRAESAKPKSNKPKPDKPSNPGINVDFDRHRSKIKHYRHVRIEDQICEYFENLARQKDVKQYGPIINDILKQFMELNPIK